MCRLIMRFQDGLPICQMFPGRGLKQPVVRFHQHIAVHEAASTDPVAMQGQLAVEKCHLEDAEAPQGRQPKKPWEVPVGLWKIMILEAFPPLDDEDRIAFFGQSHG